MFNLPTPAAKRLLRLVGACAFVSLAAACSQQAMEKFGAAASPAEDVGACAFVTAEACPVPDRSPSVAVARASVAADRATVSSK
ncbi:MAG: hypothetical protein ABI330_14035 [Caldimonas sp.]